MISARSVLNPAYFLAVVAHFLYTEEEEDEERTTNHQNTHVRRREQKEGCNGSHMIKSCVAYIVTPGAFALEVLLSGWH